MDSTSLHLRALLLFLVSLFLASDAANETCFTAIFSFGDSLADTGNLLRALHNESAFNVGQLPYGESYFQHPTGRFSNGRLVVDFIAQAMRHPLLPPYLDTPRTDCVKGGVNFAVGGATALDASYFAQKGIRLTTDSSLSVQMEWMNELLTSPPWSPSGNSSTENSTILANSLIMLGEIGGNDYNYAFFQGKKLPEIKSYVPDVVNAIANVIYELIEMGARTFLVPGNLPLGCNAAYLTSFPSDRDDHYSDIGCLNWLNDFAMYHNEVLQAELRRLQNIYSPDVTIIYADYYGAAMSMYNSTGEDTNLATCCGGGGPYNYKPSVPCGAKNSIVCDDPSSYFNWDGMHMTEAAYRRIADGILLGPFASPPLLSACKVSEI